MIELHRLENDRTSERIDEKLTDMVVAYRTFTYTDPSACDESLPHIRESGKVISGGEKIEVYLQELDRELRQQRAVTGDGCYMDPETGEIC